MITIKQRYEIYSILEKIIDHKIKNTEKTTDIKIEIIDQIEKYSIKENEKEFLRITNTTKGLIEE